RSFQNLRAIDPAFDARSALTFRVGLPANAYGAQPGITAAHQTILDRVSRLPGVTAVTGSTCLPLVEDGPRFTSTMRVQGRVLPPGTISPAVGFCAVAAGHFEAMGMSVIRGRSIGRDDVERREAVAVINQSLARAYFGAEDPIGRRVTLGPPRNQLWLTIVRILRNTPVRALTEPAPMPQLFLPMSIARPGDLPAAPDVAGQNHRTRGGGPPPRRVP